MAANLNAGKVGRSDTHIIAPEEIVVGRNSRWQQYDEDHVENLVASFEERGQDTEVTIRKIHDNRVQLVAGYNRHQAAVRFNQRHPDNPMRLRCRLIDCNEEEAYAKSISENEDRLDTSAIDKAHAQRRLREEFHWPEERIAKHYKCTTAYTHFLKKLVTLPAETQMLVHRKELSIQAAVDLCSLASADQKEVISSTGASGLKSKPDDETLVDIQAVPASVPSENLSQRVTRAVRDKKIEQGGKQMRKLSEVNAFWRKIETDNAVIISLSGLVLQFHDGSITEESMMAGLEAII